MNKKHLNLRNGDFFSYMQQIKLPKKVSFIIQTLENAGYEAFAVGGCVRDSLLHKKPNDWDITTSAKPLEVKNLFQRTLDTGIQHGTVTIMLEHEGFEVTTYRIDGEYEDSRHPKEVIFTSNLIEDLKRRDFTINAMAYNDRVGIVDAFHGIDDLNNKIIRCVGNAEERFTEDALRIMRAVRFSAQLGYDIESQTKLAITKLAPNLKNISAERIQTEFIKLLESPNPDYLRIAYDLGITAVILPEFDQCMITRQNHPHHMYTVGEHLLHCVTYINNEKADRIAALLHDIAKPKMKTTDEDGIDHFQGHAIEGEAMANQILRRLKFDNDTITKVKKYIKYHDFIIEPSEIQVRKAIHEINEAYFEGVLRLKQADLLAQSYFQREEKQDKLDKINEIYQKIKTQNQCVSLKNLQITGHDLLELGLPQGKILGIVLNQLLEEVLEDQTKNNKSYLQTRAITISQSKNSK